MLIPAENIMSCLVSAEGYDRSSFYGGDTPGYYLVAKVASVAWHSPPRSSQAWRVAFAR
jgi:hypothetical protein